MHNHVDRSRGKLMKEKNAAYRLSARVSIRSERERYYATAHTSDMIIMHY